MVWNSVGLITQFNKEGDESVDIEFHNVSLHHTIHIKNQFGYTMADMSKEAVVLASPGPQKGQDTEDAEEFTSVSTTGSNTQSKFTCILLNSCDNTKEWSIDMPRKESIRCVCASKSLVVCATSRKFLRIFCLAGTQKEIICLPGSPICMAAYDNRIFVAHTNGASIDYSIYFIDDSCMTRYIIIEYIFEKIVKKIKNFFGVFFTTLACPQVKNTFSPSAAYSLSIRVHNSLN